MLHRSWGFHRTQALLCIAALSLAACGGGGGNPPAPPQTSVTQTVNAASGGTINGPGGVTLTIPPGALAADTAITIAIDDRGAPPLPAGLTLDAPMISLTPHDTPFAVPVTLSVPVTAGGAGSTVLLKTNRSQLGWTSLPATEANGRLSAPITSLSYAGPTRAVVGPPASVQAVGVFPKTFTWNEGGFALLRADTVWGPRSSSFYLTYQWQRNGLDIGGETNDSILIDPLSASDDGVRYSVRVQIWAPGSGISTQPLPPQPISLPVTSAEVALEVLAAKPVIVNAPASVTVIAGQTATFSAASTSSLAQTIAWRRCDDPGNAGTRCVADCTAANWSDVAGAIGTTYQLANAQLSDNFARFAFAASNRSGTTCSVAVLQVLPAPVLPQIIGFSAPGPKFPGDSASFTVNATGGGLSYRWETKASGAAAFADVVPAVNAATYTISNVNSAQNGTEVRVTVSNAVGQAQLSPPAVLVVRPGATLALTRLAAAEQTSLALGGNGRLYGWGSGNLGLLGSGNRASASTPTLVPGLTDVATFAASFGHVLAVTTDGSLYAWSYNLNGQVGDGTLTDRLTPGQVADFGPAGAHGAVVSAAAGIDHSLVATVDGSVWAWGENTYGQLGNETINPSRVPQQVIGLSNIVRVVASEYGSAAIDRNGRLWVWGRCGGSGDGVNMALLRPTPVALPTKAIDVDVGTGFTVVLLDDGTVVSWGRNAAGALGSGDFSNRFTIAAVNLPDAVTGISVGSGHVLALLADGRVMAWGANSDAQLGNGTRVGSATPTVVAAPLPNTIRAISAANSHSLALDASGRVWAWGLNSNGELGDGTQNDALLPIVIPTFNLN